MSYIEPQFRIFQQFAGAPASDITPLHACVIGPQYGLHRFDVATEEASAGAYSASAGNTSAWPDKAAGSTVDLENVDVHIRDARVRYYSGADFGVPVGDTGSNRIKTDTLVLKSANGSSRSAGFGTRDVQVGDLVKVSWDAVSVETKVTAIKGEIGADIDTATAGLLNKGALTGTGPTIVTTGIADADLNIADNSSTYVGTIDGVLAETYTVTVTVSGAIGTAKAVVTTASGTDGVTEITLAATTAIGTRGVSVAITEDAPGAGLFIIGDVFTVTMSQTFVVPVPTSGGSFSGTSRTKYVVTITEGGIVGTDTPKYKVTSTNGYDVQSTASLVAGANAVGNYGVTFTVTAVAYCKGDTWTIDATPEALRPMRTLQLANKLVASGNSATSSDTLTVTLSLVDDVLVPDVYVTATATTIAIDADANATDTYLNIDATLPILSGELFVEYRELLATMSTIGSIDAAADVADVLGPVDPTNPLAFGVYKALQNSNGIAVYYVPIVSDDAAGYEGALDALSNDKLIYSLVPLTRDVATLALYETFVNEQSNEYGNNWKSLWRNNLASDIIDVYVDVDGDDLLATITETTPGQSDYTSVNVDGGQFVTKGVISGMIFRSNYRTQDGILVWDTNEVDEVLDEENLTLTASASEALSPIKIEVLREASLTEFANLIKADSAALADRRVRNIWPDVIPNEDGVEVAGYFLCAALAGYRSAVAPHASLTNAAITGFLTPTRSTMFSRTQLNAMASGGTWIVTADLNGVVFTRHQLTTDLSTEYTQEDSATTNADSCCRVYQDRLDAYIGNANVTPGVLEMLQNEVFTIFTFIHGIPYDTKLGPQILSYKLTLLEVDPVRKSRIRLAITPELPLPLNNLDMYFQVGS